MRPDQRGLPRLPWQKVVVLADIRAQCGVTGVPAHERTDLERADHESVIEILATVDRLGLDPVHIEQPAALAAYASARRGVLVYPLYAGGLSRCRALLAAASSEFLGLEFVGLDALGMTTVLDKAEAKRLARACGLRTPASIVVSSDRDIARCGAFPLPAVLKPVAGRSGLGIGPGNLARCPLDAMTRTSELLERFRQPVLVEEFVGGREVAFISIEGESDPYEAFVETVVDGTSAWFDSRLNDAAAKLAENRDRSLRRIDTELADGDLTAIRRLLGSLGHYGAVRIDGKFIDGDFHMLGVAPVPAAWLGPDGDLAQCFKPEGLSRSDVLHAILASALQAPVHRQSLPQAQAHWRRQLR